jgi:hypothetical protein
MPEHTLKESLTEDGFVHPSHNVYYVSLREMRVALHHFVPQGNHSLLRPLENGMVSQE